MKQLSVIDNLLLMIETRQAMMHVGGLLIFRLPENYEGDFFVDLFANFHNGQRTTAPFNQRLFYPLLKMGLPTWVMVVPGSVPLTFTVA